MRNQSDIKLGKPRVLGIDGNSSGLLNVEIRLEPKPDEYWRQIFNSVPSGVSVPVSMHPPKVIGDNVFIRPPDSEVETYVAKVKEWVEATNLNYAERVEPKLRAEKEAEERDKEERRRRIEDAQKLLDDAGDTA